MLRSAINFFDRRSPRSQSGSSSDMKNKIYQPINIISDPDKYQDEASGLKYALVLSLDSIEMIHFLLQTNDKLWQLNGPCKIYFSQVTAVILSNLMSSGKISTIDVQEIAKKFVEIKYRVHLRKIKISPQYTLLDFYQDMASGNRPNAPYDNNYLAMLRQDFFMTSISESRDFCSLVTLNPAFTFLLDQYCSVFFIKDNFKQINLFLEKICLVAAETPDFVLIFSDYLKNLLKRIFIYYIDQYRMLPHLFFADDLFWNLMDSYSVTDKKELAMLLDHDDLRDIAIERVTEAIKDGNKRNAMRILKGEVLYEISLRCSHRVRKFFVVALLQLEDARIDSIVCKTLGNRVLIGKLNNHAADNMLARLTNWFSYESLIAGRERQVASDIELVEASRKKIRAFNELIFISESEADNLKRMNNGQKFNEIKIRWIAEHKRLVNIIFKNFFPYIKNHLGKIHDIHKQYEELLIMKLVREDENRFDPEQYCFSHFPEPVKESMSSNDIVQCELICKHLHSIWIQMKETMDSFYLDHKDNPIEGFVAIDTIFDLLANKRYARIFKEKEIRHLKEQFANILIDILSKNHPEKLEADKLKNVKENKCAAYINSQYSTILIAILENGEVFDLSSKHPVFSEKKLIACLDTFFKSLSNQHITEKQYRLC